MIETPALLEGFEYRDHLPGGRTRPLLMAAMDNDGREYLIVLKLRLPEPRIGDGHYGPTSLACELLCSMLARSIGLSVPDYFVVNIAKALADAMPNRSLRDLLKTNIGENFGCLYHEGYALWDPHQRPRSSDTVEALEEVLTFDATVINGDRNCIKPNLLARGANLLLIDHSLALPVHLWDEETLSESPNFPAENVREHCTFRALHKAGVGFERLLERWREGVTAADINRLRAVIPAAWETRAGDLDRVFRFLSERPVRFGEIAKHLRGIVA